jgi:hypothetical protein
VGKVIVYILSVPKTILALALAFALSGCAVLASKEAVVACQAADAVTTWHALDLGAREANPFVEWLLENFGAGGFFAAKVGVTLLFLQVYPEISSTVVVALNAATCGIALRNAVIAGELGQD